MPRRRTPQAFQGKGGRWIRVPRPKPKPKAPSQQQPTGDGEKFRVCALCDPAELDSALVTEAQPIISLLLDMGSTEAAGIVMALCDRVTEREREVRRLKSANHQQGLVGHLWWKCRHQKRQSIEQENKSRVKDFHLRLAQRQLANYKQRHPPWPP